MNYVDIRDSIKSGDIITLEKNTKNFVYTMFSNLIQFFTRKKYTHSMVAVWMNDGFNNRLMCVEAHSGKVRICNVSVYSDRKMIVIEAPVPWEVCAEDYMNKVAIVDYSYLDFIGIGLREFFGIKVPNQDGEVCSEMVANICRKHGVQLTTELVSPGKLVDELLALGLKVVART